MANVNSKKLEQKKIYVLDTSILLYNHHKSLLSFEENNVVIPITVFVEIDKFKKGNDTINYEAR